MIDKWDDAGREAMDRWTKAIDGMGAQQGTRGPVPREAIVERYVREHRNNPRALMEFAAQNVGQERAAQEAIRYRAEMERLLQGRS